MVKEIPMKSISLEEKFRNCTEDDHLSKSIEKSGIVEPLIVEGPTEDKKYILVEGYRRLECLSRLGFTKARCIINKVSTEENRVMKRLEMELNKKKKTGYELERMIEFLLNRSYSVERISEECGVSANTIKKHIKSIDVDTGIKRRAEENKVGKDGLTRLYNLPNILSSLKDSLLEKYLQKLLYGYHIDSLEMVVNNPFFKSLSKESQEKCINEAIQLSKLTKEKADKIVYSEYIKINFTKRHCDIIYEEINSQLLKVVDMCHSNLIKGMDHQQYKELNDLIKKLSLRISLPRIDELVPNNKMFYKRIIFQRSKRQKTNV